MSLHQSHIVSTTFRPTRWALQLSVALLALNSMSGQAQTISYPSDPYLMPGGILQLSLSAGAQGFTNLGVSVVSNSPIAQPALYTGQPPLVVNSVASVNVSSMVVNGRTQTTLSGVTGDALGITFAAAPKASLFTGGSLLITNLHLDLATGTVSGNVNGSNGVGTHDNVALWQAGEVSANATATGNWTGDWEAFNFQAAASGLSLTQQGKTYLTQALGAQLTATFTLSAALQDFGTLQASAVLMSAMGTPITVVPEASTFATMGLGLVGLGGLMARRRRA